MSSTSCAQRVVAVLGLCLLSLATACGVEEASADDGEDPGTESEAPVNLESTTTTGRKRSAALAPVVSSIAPTALAATGGTTLHVYGSNYVAGSALSVRIGGSVCTSVVWVASTHLTCITPAKAAGVYDVVVVNPNGTTSGTSGTGKYQAIANPTVTSVVPARGPLAGGTAVSLTGTSFVSGATVTVGGVACTSVVRVSATQITAVTPAGTAGARDIVVTNPSGQRVTVTGGFTYETAAVVVPVTIANLHGTNLLGMEGGYGFNHATGPIPNTEYAVHGTQVIDYLASKRVNVVRFLFSWERMQSTLGGPIPAATTGNYKAYFDDYKRIVDYATNVKGMTVIVEPWQASATGGAGGPSWRGNLVGGGVVTSAHFANFWSRMSTVFASNPRVTVGLVNEPNSMNTMTWFSAAQAAITAIRTAGFKGDIHVPGNGWTGAGSWNDAWYDTGYPQRSNAYGWQNARGVGLPLLDSLKRLVVGVHTYADADAGGSSSEVVSTTISRTRVKVVTDWARANGLKVFIGEIGMYAGATNAVANWNDFAAYASANTDTIVGWAWWGCGKSGWWDDVAANNGGHYSITPTSNYTVDTVNMNMIETAF